MKVGDKVRWELKGRPVAHRLDPEKCHGTGVITVAYPPLGNCPWTYMVSTYPRVLFEDEVKRL